MKILNREVFDLHASFCKTLANPKRLMILAMLGVREMSVGEMARTIGVPLSNISQHLAVLRGHRIVNVSKEGQTAYYSICDPRLVDACNLIRSVLLDDLKTRGLVAQELDAVRVVADEA